MDLRVLFWNLGGRRDLSSEVAALAREYRPDIIGLCETVDSRWDSFRVELCVIGTGFVNVGEERPRIRLFARSDWPTREVQARSDHYAVYVVEPHGVDPFVIGLAHFASKLRTSIKARRKTAFSMRSALIEAEAEELDQPGIRNGRVFAVGDFNSDPWEPPMVHVDGMNAIEDWDLDFRRVKLAPGDRKFEVVPAFYNPMWTRVGRRGTRPKGTYFFENANSESHRWHAYDTFLVRNGHVQKIGVPKLRILTRLPDGTELVDKAGRPLGKEEMSDHLPILATVPL